MYKYPQAKRAISALTPKLQSITTLWLALISHPTGGRRLSWSWWLNEILTTSPIQPLGSCKPGIELVTIKSMPTVLPSHTSIYHLNTADKLLHICINDQHQYCMHKWQTKNILKLECGPMPNVMVALPNIGGALCSTPQSLPDAHY